MQNKVECAPVVKSIARWRTMRALRLRVRIRQFSIRWTWMGGSWDGVRSSILHAMGDCWMRAGFRGRSQMAGARVWLIAVASVMIQILALGSDVGFRNTIETREQSVWLSRLTCCSFAISTRLRTYVNGRLCSGFSVGGRQKKRGSTVCRFVDTNCRTIIFFMSNLVNWWRKPGFEHRPGTNVMSRRFVSWHNLEAYRIPIKCVTQSIKLPKA